MNQTKPTHFLILSLTHMLRCLLSIILASQFSSQLKLTEKNENNVAQPGNPIQAEQPDIQTKQLFLRFVQKSFLPLMTVLAASHSFVITNNGMQNVGPN